MEWDEQELLRHPQPVYPKPVNLPSLRKEQGAGDGATTIVPWGGPRSKEEGQGEAGAQHGDPLPALPEKATWASGQGGPPPRQPRRPSPPPRTGVPSPWGFPSLSGVADVAGGGEDRPPRGKDLEREAFHRPPHTDSRLPRRLPLLSRLPADDGDQRPAPTLPALPSLAALVGAADWSRLGEIPAFRGALAEALAADGRHALLSARRVASLAESGLLGGPAQTRAALRPAWRRVEEGLEEAMQLAPPGLQKAFLQECTQLTVLHPSLELHRVGRFELNNLALSMGVPGGRTCSRDELLVALADEDAARRAGAHPPRPLPPQHVLAYRMLTRWRVTYWEAVRTGLQVSLLNRLPHLAFCGAAPGRKNATWAHPPEGRDVAMYRLRDVIAAKGTHWNKLPARALQEDVRTRGKTCEALAGIVLCPRGAPCSEGRALEVPPAVEAARAAAAAARRERDAAESAGLTIKQKKEKRALRRQQRALEAARQVAREEAQAALRFGDGAHLRATITRLEERRREALGEQTANSCAECPFCQRGSMVVWSGGVERSCGTSVEGVLSHLMEAPCWAAAQCFPR